MSAGLFSEPSEARARFRTLEVGGTVSYDGAALARLSMQAASAHVGNSESTRVYAADGGGGRGEQRYKWRVWWVLPSLWRDDLTWPGGGTTVSVVRDAAALVYVSAQRMFFTSEPLEHDPRWEVARAPIGIMELPTIANRLAEFPLLRPPLPASEWAFETVSERQLHNGRATRLVRATRRVDAPPAVGPDASGYWMGVDQYECLVDDALRILMRLTAIADGVPVGVVSADDVRVDAALPSNIFTFVPPPGTRIAQVARRA